MIESWERKFEKLDREVVVMRLRLYLGSLILGREFGETVENYLERKGYTEFYTWAHEQFKI